MTNTDYSSRRLKMIRVMEANGWNKRIFNLIFSMFKF